MEITKDILQNSSDQMVSKCCYIMESPGGSLKYTDIWLPPNTLIRQQWGESWAFGFLKVLPVILLCSLENTGSNTEKSSQQKSSR